MFGWRIAEDGRPPGHLIVGKVTENSAIIWARGAPRFASVVLRVEAAESKADEAAMPRQCVDLDAAEDNIAVATFGGLAADTSYQVTAVFRSPYGFDDDDDCRRMAEASFHTSPDPKDEQSAEFSFLLGSCNLSIVSINNLAARGLQIIGVYAARQSLRRPTADGDPRPRPLESWWSKSGRWWMRSRFRRRVVDLALKLGVGAIFVGTGGKWPRQPLLRSPFLKLEALFAGQAVQFYCGHRQPMPGDVIRGSRSGASGTLAFAPWLTKGQWRRKNDDLTGTDRTAEGSLILLDVKKEFEPGERLFILSQDKAGRGPTDLGTVGCFKQAAKVTSAYKEPSFTIHAGDQIYFDFPEARRPPEVGRYHEAYREAWFEDRYQRSFLARGAHYMTLDDHEIVDQFSIDQTCEPAQGYEAEDFSAQTYSGAAETAFRHYVQQRQCAATRYFGFDHGQARFFLLDTRFERRRSVDTTMGDRDPNTRMIGDEQMQALKDWLTKDEDNRLRFVVSSVPFVAEVLRESGDGRAATDRSDDKWSGAPFRRQREEIIELIDAKRIEHVVFLVGDMHCAYHASMTIGQGRRWERLRIHELAGGPINQLQQGRRRQFVTAASHTTRQGKVPYDIRLHQFHSGANAVMHIEVDSVEDAHLGKNVPEVRWRVIRTLTNFDAGPLFNEERSECGRVEEEAPISGRIVTRPAERGAAS